MNSTEYTHYTEQLIRTAQADPDVIGLVACGSMAAAHRRDQWSDHDFFWVVAPGKQEGYRTDLHWLPDAEHIVLQFRETAHGLKVMYRSGHLIEFAVFEPDDLALAPVNDYAVLVDKADIAPRVKLKEYVPPPVNRLKEVLHMLSLLQVGSGRVARGEVISGQLFIKTYALGHLLRTLASTLGTANVLDTLDPYRRFERAAPDISQRIHALLLSDPLDCAIGFIDLIEAELPAHMPDFPSEAAQVVRSFVQKARESISASTS
jgi:lincosamide nucleotidyltransferase B/F